MTPHAASPWLPYTDMSDTERVAAARGFYNMICTRRSCRFIGDAPIPLDVIDAAIAAAGTAPSGANHQPWHFAVVTSPAIKTEIRNLAEAEERAFYAGKAGADWLDALTPLGTDDSKPYLSDAPALIVIFGQRKHRRNGGQQPSDTKQNYYVTESVGIATGFLLAALHMAGLATLTHTPAPMKFLNGLCNRPADEKPVMIIVVGHARDDATIPDHATIKKPLNAIRSLL